MHRVPGGPVLRVVGDHAVPLPQCRGAIGPAVQPGPRPRLPDRSRRDRGRRSISRCSASSTSWPRRPTSRPPPTPTATCSWSATVGPFPVTYTTGSKSTVEQRTWKIYEVGELGRGGPPRLPAGGDDGRFQGWPGLARPPPESGTSTPALWDVYEAASGPKSWARVSRHHDQPASDRPSAGAGLRHPRGDRVDLVQRRSDRRAGPGQRPRTSRTGASAAPAASTGSPPT